MPDFSFRDRPDKQRVQLTLGKASSSADAEQVLAFLDFQWTFRTMKPPMNNYSININFQNPSSLF